IVNAGGSLVLRSGVVVTNESLTLNGSGFLTHGALSSDSGGTNSWSGDINLATDSVISTYGAMNLTNAISGPGALTKVGVGTLVFAGTNKNTYTGTTTVNAGTLLLEKTGVVFGAIPGELVIGDGVGGPNADVVRLLQP